MCRCKVLIRYDALYDEKLGLMLLVLVEKNGEFLRTEKDESFDGFTYRREDTK